MVYFEESFNKLIIFFSLQVLLRVSIINEKKLLFKMCSINKINLQFLKQKLFISLTFSIIYIYNNWFNFKLILNIVWKYKLNHEKFLFEPISISKLKISIYWIIFELLKILYSSMISIVILVSCYFLFATIYLSFILEKISELIKIESMVKL